MSHIGPRTQWLLVWAAAVALFLWLYAGLLDAWWMGDDTQHLLSVVRNGIAAHFWRPHEQNGLIPANLTPWLYLEYGLDWAVGGLDPQFAYRHHMLVWMVAIATLACLLTRLLGPIAAALGLLLWLPSESVGAVAQLLCTRHYLSGLVFAALAVLIFLDWERTPGAARSTAIAVLYVLAVSAKEVYVPLGPALLAAHALRHAPVTRWNQWGTLAASLWRAAAQLWPLVVIMVAYVFWRGHMLGFGRLFAGYANPQLKTSLRDVVNLPATAATMIHGNTGWAALALLVIVVGTLLALTSTSPAKRRSYLLIGPLTAFLVLAPIYPVLAQVRVNPNYLFLPSLIWTAWLGWSLQTCLLRAVALGRIQQRVLGTGVAAVVTGALVVGQFRAHSAFWLWADRSHLVQGRAEGEAALSGSYPGVILNARGADWHHSALRDLQRDVLGRADPGLTLLCDGVACEKTLLEASASQCFRFEAQVGGLAPVDCSYH